VVGIGGFSRRTAEAQWRLLESGQDPKSGSGRSVEQELSCDPSQKSLGIALRHWAVYCRFQYDWRRHSSSQAVEVYDPLQFRIRRGGCRLQSPVGTCR
jgi:hypothetical protein